MVKFQTSQACFYTQQTYYTYQDKMKETNTNFQQIIMSMKFSQKSLEGWHN